MAYLGHQELLELQTTFMKYLLRNNKRKKLWNTYSLSSLYLFCLLLWGTAVNSSEIRLPPSISHKFFTETENQHKHYARFETNPNWKWNQKWN